MNMNECFDNNYSDNHYETKFNNYYADYNNDHDNVPTYSDSYYCDDNVAQYATFVEEPLSDEPQASVSSETTQDFQITKQYKRLK